MYYYPLCENEISFFVEPCAVNILPSIIVYIAYCLKMAGQQIHVAMIITF